MFFSRREIVSICVGDRFEKQSHPRTLWRVEAVIDRPDVPRHVRLVDDAHRRVATVAQSVLSGPDYRVVSADRSV
jgi:hypothetical protein